MSELVQELFLLQMAQMVIAVILTFRYGLL